MDKNKYSGIFRDGGAGKDALKRFRDRRKKIMHEVNALTVLAGVPYGPGQETKWAYTDSPTYQEPALMYLTGINQAQIILLLDPSSKESREILFLLPKDPVKEFWDGVRFGVGDSKSISEVKRITGIKDVRDLKEFDSVLEKRLRKQKRRQLGTFWLEGTRGGKKVEVKTDHNWNFRKRLVGLLKKWKVPNASLLNIMKPHFELRLPLDSLDSANALKANVITGNAFKATLRHFGFFNNECQVKGFIESQMLVHSSYGLSYPSIIASGTNATVLHYMKDDDAIGKNELVLMDFGVRWMTMHADITRTLPASGKFNPLQKFLYEIVLSAQLKVEKMAREGVTIEALNDCCWASVNEDLKNKFKKAGGTYKLKYKDRPHGVSHLMGEQEHDGDPFRNYASQPMRAGWMISSEPGLYGSFRWKYKGKVYEEEIGIRIEDNLLITAKGCKNLSRSVIKSVEDIEWWMAAKRRSGLMNPLLFHKVAKS